MTLAPTGPAGDVAAAAVAAGAAVLRGYLTRTAPRADDADCGPPVLAAALAAADPALPDLAGAAVGAWIARLPESVPYPGAFGGIAGIYVGCVTAAPLVPPLAGLAAVCRDRLLSTPFAPRGTTVEWPDYDLVSGPAGVLLALTTTDPVPDIQPVAAVLAARAADGALDGFRVTGYADDEQRAWNHGRVNAGLAHGVPGVVAALAAAAAGDEPGGTAARSLRALAARLAAAAYVDGRGVVTWPPYLPEGEHRPHGTSARQAWCYGTPGVALALRRAAVALDDPALATVAAEAMASFCAAFDPEFHVDAAPLDAHLGICHGMAGTMLVADEFARAGLRAAAPVRDELVRRLTARLPGVVALGRSNVTVLTGAGGVVAALLTVAGGDRRWLRHLAFG